MGLITRPGSKNLYIKFKYLGKVYFFSAGTEDEKFAAKKERDFRTKLESKLYMDSQLSDEDKEKIERSQIVSPKFKDYVALPDMLPDAEKNFAGGEWWTRYANAEYTVANSREMYRNRISAMLQFPKLANAQLDEIDDAVVADYLTFRLGQRMKPATVNLDRSVLHVILVKARQMKYIDALPEFPERLDEKFIGVALTAEEEALYMDAAAYHPDLLLCASILIDTGLEPGAIASLDWKDVHLTPKRDHGDGWIHGTCEKAVTRSRDIPMTPRLLAIMKERWLKAGRPSSGWVFPSRRGGHLTNQRFRQAHADIWSKRSKKDPFPVKRFRLYDLRHTVLTRLAEGGANEFELMAFAGWTSPQMARRYVHVSQQTRARASVKLNAYLAEMQRSAMSNAASN